MSRQSPSQGYPGRSRAAYAEPEKDRPCAWPGCDDCGRYRAPRSPDRLREFVWLCLDHVRAYNKSWDYFKGMSAAEIDAHRREDVTWHRPTWRASAGASAHRFTWQDPLGVFGDAAPPKPDLQARELAMMRVLGLDVGFTLTELRSRYRILVKECHPDLHGGDRRNEEALRTVIEAYRYLVANELYAEG
jgi:hypothetical protein